jgi:signal transduction histidine kinase
MTEDQEQHIRRQNLAFFGTITASVSHELSNVVTIINELSGMLGDMLDATDKGKELDNEKLRRLQQRLANQIPRADGIIKRLNRFAHTSDQPVMAYDANAAIGNLIDLAQRLASLKRVKIEGALCNDVASVEGSPFMMLNAVYLCLKKAIESASEGDTITVATMCDKTELTISMRSSGGAHDGNELPYESLVPSLVDKLGGTLTLSSSSGESRYAISLPRSARK